MKGVLLSLLVFFLYFVSTVIVSHLGRFQRHSKLFLPALAVWTPVYFALYWLTSPTLGFLAPPWLATHRWTDIIYGYVIFVLNVHSYMDFFFGFNGGFSSSMLVRLMKAGPAGLTLGEVIANYRTSDGTDKLFAWRLPRLAETGYLSIDSTSGRCRLTAKGRLVATLGLFCKNILNLGKGG
jgi:hypothetical protein